MTLGDSRVGIDINPSGSKTIAEIKRRAADLMGAVDAIDLPGEAPGEIARLKALAMTEIESAVMWAVMAAARSEAASRLPGVAARIATTLRSFCEAVGWPRLRRLSDAIARVRESERRAAAAPKPAPAPGPALTADPQGEIHLAVTWQREIDDSGGKYPPAESGGGWLYGTSDDPRLAITLAWTEAKFDRSTRENYETLHFVTAIGEVEGKTLFVSGRCVGRVTYSNIPCDAQLYHEVHGALKEDHGGGFFTSQTTQVIVAFRRGDEHMQQSPQGDLFSAPPEPLAERYELDEAWQTTAFSIAYGGEAAADRVGEDTEAEHSAALAWDEDSLMTSCPRRCCLEEAPLAAPLHLLRGMPAAINGRSVDFLAFRRLVNQWAREQGTVFGSWMRRAVRPSLPAGPRTSSSRARRCSECPSSAWSRCATASRTCPSATATTPPSSAPRTSSWSRRVPYASCAVGVTSTAPTSRPTSMCPPTSTTPRPHRHRLPRPANYATSASPERAHLAVPARLDLTPPNPPPRRLPPRPHPASPGHTLATAPCPPANPHQAPRVASRHASATTRESRPCR